MVGTLVFFGVGIGSVMLICAHVDGVDLIHELAQGIDRTGKFLFGPGF